MTSIVVAGACGRMGRAILNAAFKDPSLKIAGALELASCPDQGKDVGQVLGLGKETGILVSSDPASVLKDADALIDFTHISSVSGFLKACAASQTGYVVGTTGLDAKTLEEISVAAKKIPIVQSPNMSIGVNLLFRMADLAAKVLDDAYDAEISEIHHRLKKDAPSGTAMKLLEILAAARAKDLKKDVVYGREGDVGARPKGEIGVVALRGGDVIGEHTVHFFGDGERVELTHKASSREVFAMGSLRAAKFVASGKVGLYNMQHVLGL